MRKVEEYINELDFFDPRSRLVFKAFKELWQESSKIDLILLDARLQDKGVDTEYLMEVAGNPGGLHPGHIIKYAKKVKDFSFRRKFLSMVQLGWASVESRTEGFQKIVDDNLTRAAELNAEYHRCFSEQGEDFDKALEKVISRRDPGFRGYNSGIRVLDENTIGLKPGHLWLLYAKSGTGKTKAACHIAETVLKQLNKGEEVRFLSCEMSSEEIWNQMVQQEEARGLDFGLALDRIKEYPGRMVVEDSLIDLGRVAGYVRQHSAKTKLFVIDYLTLLEDGGARKMDEITRICHNAREVQKIAQINKVAILCLAQANTDNHILKQKPWEMSIKGGNSVEAVATVIVKLVRYVQDEGTAMERDVLSVHLQKNKFGRGRIDAVHEINPFHGGIGKEINHKK
jgi:replicative DNA helicase